MANLEKAQKFFDEFIIPEVFEKYQIVLIPEGFKENQIIQSTARLDLEGTVSIDLVGFLKKFLEKARSNNLSKLGFETRVIKKSNLNADLIFIACGVLALSLIWKYFLNIDAADFSELDIKKLTEKKKPTQYEAQEKHTAILAYLELYYLYLFQGIQSYARNFRRLIRKMSKKALWKEIMQLFMLYFFYFYVNNKNNKNVENLKKILISLRSKIVASLQTFLPSYLSYLSNVEVLFQFEEIFYETFKLQLLTTAIRKYFNYLFNFINSKKPSKYLLPKNANFLALFLSGIIYQQSFLQMLYRDSYTLLDVMYHLSLRFYEKTLPSAASAVRDTARNSILFPILEMVLLSAYCKYILLFWNFSRIIKSCFKNVVKSDNSEIENVKR